MIRSGLWSSPSRSPPPPRAVVGLRRAATLTDPPCEVFREEGRCVEDWAMSTRSKSGLSVEFSRICLSMALGGLTGCVARLEDEQTRRRLCSLLTPYLCMCYVSDVTHKSQACGKFGRSIVALKSSDRLRSCLTRSNSISYSDNLHHIQIRIAMLRVPVKTK